MVFKISFVRYHLTNDKNGGQIENECCAAKLHFGKDFSNENWEDNEGNFSRDTITCGNIGQKYIYNKQDADWIRPPHY